MTDRDEQEIAYYIRALARRVQTRDFPTHVRRAAQIIQTSVDVTALRQVLDAVIADRGRRGVDLLRWAVRLDARFRLIASYRLEIERALQAIT